VDSAHDSRHGSAVKKGQKALVSNTLGKWLLAGFVCTLFIGVIGFFGLYHLLFRIPLLKLWKPYTIISVLTLTTFGAMYWANNSSFNRLKRRAVLVGAYICSTSIVGIYYAAQAGLMPTKEVVGFSIFMATGLVISSVLAYFIRKRLSQGSG
jgi:hypothetical protein